MVLHFDCVKRGEFMLYFDQAATSFPKPRGMMEVMEDCMARYCGNPGRSGHAMSMKMGEKVYEARKQLAGLLGIMDPSRLIFTKNTTESLNLAMRGVLREGDHVVTTSMEHNSVLRPLRDLERSGVEHTIVSANRYGEIFPKDIQAAVNERTKLIVMTGASNVTGTVMPIDAVCRFATAKGILTLIDGAQCIGSVPLDVKKTNISMLAFPGHKGLLGPPGTGGLYVAADVAEMAGIEELPPLLYGGTGSASKETRQPLDFPGGYEAGTINGPGIIGLGYAAKVIEDIGIEAIGSHERELMRYFEDYLRNMDFVVCYGPEAGGRTGITLFNIKGLSSEEVTERLSREYGIAVRGGFHCAGLAHETIGTGNDGAVRVSVGPFNTRWEIRQLAEAIYRIGRSVHGSPHRRNA